MSLAPIVLFVYNRPWHTKQTVEALQKNELAEQSELFIYSDEAKNDDVRKSVDEVREYIDKIDGFKKVTVIKREKNWGLANSIIDGVTKIVNEYGKIIVLEDDLITSSYFLKFMNEALEFYKDEKKVWHISGWNCPIDTDGLHDVFLWRFMNCWGWGTWYDRWKSYEKDVDKIIDEFSNDDIRRFNLDGAKDFWIQIMANKDNKIDTWAIFWYETIFKEKGLCLNPTQTYVENIGLDGSGVHCEESKVFESNTSEKTKITFNTNMTEDKLAYKRIQLFYKNQKKNFLTRIINKVSRMILKKNLIK